MTLRSHLTHAYSVLESWNPTTRSFWRAWLVIASAVAVVHAATLTISPIMWQDEVHIIEAGRVFLERNTTWALFWHSGRPLIHWYYVGAVFQDLATRATMPSCWGPRLLALAGALAASAALASWLRSKRVLPSACLLLGILFLLEPSFVLGYRGDRLDAWAFAWTFLACRIVAGSTNGKDEKWRFLSAGACLSVSFAVWPSAVFVFPLACLEFIRVLKKRAPFPWLSAAACALGAVLTIATLETPALLRHPALLSGVSTVLAGTGTIRQSIPLIGLLRGAWEIVFTLFVLSPWNALLCALVWRHARSRAVLLVGGVTAIAILPTHVYVHRIVYLLPYVVAFIAEGFYRNNPNPIANHATTTTAGSVPSTHSGEDHFTHGSAPSPEPLLPSPRRAWLALGIAILGVAGVSLGVRPADAWLQREVRDEARLLAAAREAKLTGMAVCVQPFELYLPGRMLGWRMFTPPGLFTPDGAPEPKSDQPPCDAAIVRPTETRMVERLERDGFYRTESLLDAPPPPSFYPMRGYGPYAVYRRGPATSPSPSQQH